MKLFQSLRSKLTIVYALTIVTPFVILAFVLPFYSQHVLMSDTEKLTEGTLHALAGNIETYLDDLERLTATPYLNDNVIQALKIRADNMYDVANAYTKLQTDRALKGTLPNYLINTRKDILSTLIITVNGKAYLTTKNNTIGLMPDFKFHDQPWYKKAIEQDGKVAFISPHPQNYLTHQVSPQVFSVSRLIKNPESGKPLAVILADADTNLLEKMTKDIKFNVRSVVAIVDEFQNLIYANKPLTPSMLRQLKHDARSSSEDSGYVTVSQRIEPANWTMTVFLSSQEMQNKVRWVYMTAVLISVGGLVVTFFVFLYFSQWIVKPVKQMNEVMNKVKTGNLQARYEMSGSDELSYLGQSLNKMISQLDELINREYKAMLAQRNAEYRALQSQIQPHFLYNTLNGFIALNRIGKKQELEKAILSLSGMLRYILEDNQWTTIEQEFLFLSRYAVLQQLRFQDKLRIVIHHEASVAGFSIPKLLFQPILENAIIHGVEPDDKNNEIHVLAFEAVHEEIPCILIEIRDNGVGFDTLAQPAQSRIGLSNVNARLQLVYPHAKLEVQSIPGSGTRVIIMIPKGEEHL